ncbi:MAG: hypothetical protein PGN26_03810 [Xylophilus ampelinus]
MTPHPSAPAPAPAPVPTHALLVQALLAPGDATAAFRAWEALAASWETASDWDAPRGTLRLERLAHAAASDGPRPAYAYFRLPAPHPMDTRDALAFAVAAETAFPAARELRAARLERVFAAEGASAGAAPRMHYVVEMDPEAGWMPDIARWYDEEHMPGLAAVPGCVRAERFLNHDSGPLSLACYDLETEAAFNSPPWLAVRATDWSSRMRPHFTNTVRTMFSRLPAPPDAGG